MTVTFWKSMCSRMHCQLGFGVLNWPRNETDALIPGRVEKEWLSHLDHCLVRAESPTSLHSQWNNGLVIDPFKSCHPNFILSEQGEFFSVMRNFPEHQQRKSIHEVYPQSFFESIWFQSLHQLLSGSLALMAQLCFNMCCPLLVLPPISFAVSVLAEVQTDAFILLPATSCRYKAGGCS